MCFILENIFLVSVGAVPPHTKQRIPSSVYSPQTNRKITFIIQSYVFDSTARFIIPYRFLVYLLKFNISNNNEKRR